MTKGELKVIRAAMRATRDLITTLNEGRELPSSLEMMIDELNENAIIISEMIDKEDDNA